jgi:prephenate dehydratase
MGIRISYMGIPFSNSEEAAGKFAGSHGWKDAELIPEMSSEGVVRSLTEGRSDYGVVASSNITAGPVQETEEALRGRDDIARLCTDTVPIHHCVFVKNTNTEIHTVSSHIQALLQTRDHLSRLYPNTGRLEVEDTAYAAEMLAEGKLADDVAVVCRKNAGEHYGLILVHENIEDRSDNMTTFTLLKMKE